MSEPSKVAGEMSIGRLWARLRDAVGHDPAVALWHREVWPKYLGREPEDGVAYSIDDVEKFCAIAAEVVVREEAKR